MVRVRHTKTNAPRPTFSGVVIRTRDPTAATATDRDRMPASILASYCSHVETWSHERGQSEVRLMDKVARHLEGMEDPWLLIAQSSWSGSESHLRRLIQTAEGCREELGVVTISGARMQPWVAAYERRLAPIIDESLRTGVASMSEMLQGLASSIYWVPV